MFKKPRSLGIRLWHWLNALVIAGLLVTVLLRDTLFNAGNNAKVIRDKLEGAGATVTVEQARAGARVLGQNLWAWHVYFGYALAALVVVRGVVFLVDRRAPEPAVEASVAEARKTLHYRLVKGLHKSFYAALVVVALTGLELAFKDAFGLGKPIQQLVHGVHENLMWFVIAFIILHVGGVVRSEQREDAGIVSEMLHGGARPPASTSTGSPS